MKKSVSALLALALLLGLSAGCKSPGEGPGAVSGSQPGSASQPGGTSQPGGSSQITPPDPGPGPEGPDDPAGTVSVMVLSGPTGVGAAKLMSDSEAGCAYSFQVVGDNSEVTAALVRPDGPVDIACIATNVAANLYNKTDGAIQILAVNTLGVLYILEKGDKVQEVSDLRGRTIYATGQGANPEFILNHLLRKNDLDPAGDVDIQWMTAQEVTAKMAASADGVCMLPVPAATALLMKDTSVRQALDVSAEWDQVSDSPLVMGCVVARTRFIQENPAAVERFLEEYGQSIAYMSDPENLDSAAALVAQYGITASAQAAKAAIPQCNLTFLTGTEMRGAVQDYYGVLYEADPASIGGGNPDDDFYYNP